ncbi:MAG: zinc ribbon domain-containing protein, partial [Candidatus Thermoplasmatota archaeon]|nr:zinc ribbon domain-containing protein [Candidatus Thermoplasmatota archaeon]
SSIVFRGVALHVNGTEDGDDTIFGLPKTYFAISVVFITVIVIFLTWSYFKGRRMQKKMKEEAENSNMVCSACGAPLSIDDKRCPGCHAEIEEEEHICGACKKAISEKDTVCPHCGVRLKNEIVDDKGREQGKKDPDLEKIGTKVDMTGKKRCGKCGAVYLEKEGSCPECGK